MKNSILMIYWKEKDKYKTYIHILKSSGIPFCRKYKHEGIIVNIWMASPSFCLRGHGKE